MQSLKKWQCLPWSFSQAAARGELHKIRKGMIMKEEDAEPNRESTHWRSKGASQNDGEEKYQENSKH